jgi:hypothetical protein
MVAVVNACTTEDVSRQTYVLDQSEGGPSGKGVLSIQFGVRAEAALPSTLRLAINGKLAVTGGNYVPLPTNSGSSFEHFIAPGSFIVSAEKEDGTTLVTSEPVTVVAHKETRVVVYGTKGAFKTLAVNQQDLPVLTDTGEYLFRALNVMASGEALDIVQCPSESWECTTLYAGLTYGEMFERAVPTSATGFGVRYPACPDTADETCTLRFWDDSVEPVKPPLVTLFPARRMTASFPGILVQFPGG